jgi:tetratricopeptide (TPR) repeat protein
MKKLIVLGFVVLFMACPSAPKNSAKIYITRGEYTSAKEQIMVGLEQTPSDYELYCLLTQVEIGLTDWLAASDAFKQATAIDSLKAISWILADKGNLPVYSQAFYNAGVQYMQNKKYQEALRNLRYCKVIDPENVNVYILEGAMYSELGEKEKAQKAYSTALSVDPENPEAYFRIGKAYFENKAYDSALVKFSKAITFFEKRYNTITKVVFQNLPDIDKKLAQKIITLWADKKTDELNELVKVQLGFDNPEAQKRNIETLYKATESLARSHYYHGMTYYNMDDIDKALSSIMKSLDLMPTDLDALYFAGELLIRQKKYKEAVAMFEEATKLRSDDVYSWFYLAVCYTQMKNYKKAIEIYEMQVLKLDPKNTDAMTNLAFCYREIGNNKKSLEYLMKVEQLQKEK